MSPVISDSHHLKTELIFLLLPMLFLLYFQCKMFWCHYIHSCWSQKSKVHIRWPLHHCLPLMWLNGAIFSPNSRCMWSPLYFYRHSLSFGHHHLLSQSSQSLTGLSTSVWFLFFHSTDTWKSLPQVPGPMQVLGTHHWAISLLELIFWWWMYMKTLVEEQMKYWMQGGT